MICSLMVLVMGTFLWPERRTNVHLSKILSGAPYKCCLLEIFFTFLIVRITNFPTVYTTSLNNKSDHTFTNIFRPDANFALFFPSTDVQ